MTLLDARCRCAAWITFSRAVHVGLDALHRVVFGGGHLLQRGGVDDDSRTPACAAQPLGVAHVADEVAQATGSVKLLLHLVLLQLVARVDDEPARAGAAAARVRTKALPNEPVPPVMRMLWLSNMAVALMSGCHVTPTRCAFRPEFVEHCPIWHCLCEVRQVSSARRRHLMTSLALAFVVSFMVTALLVRVSRIPAWAGRMTARTVCRSSMPGRPARRRPGRRHGPARADALGHGHGPRPHPEALAPLALRPPRPCRRLSRGHHEAGQRPHAPDRHHGQRRPDVVAARRPAHRRAAPRRQLAARLSRREPALHDGRHRRRGERREHHRRL